MIPEIKGLHVITDSEIAKPRSLIEVIKQSIAGGATVIQLRDKTASDEDMIALGREILKLTSGNIPLIINDRIKVALALNAQGIHVGQSDLPARQVRNLISPEMILGVSALTADQAVKAQEDGADYLGVGPIFPTSSKPDADPAIGLAGLIKIKNAVRIPIIAIGGINKANALEVMRYAEGIAVISAVMGAENPFKASQELSVIINSKRKAG
jgi:thiamine-phosphate pyrophosphorylase